MKFVAMLAIIQTVAFLGLIGISYASSEISIVTSRPVTKYEETAFLFKLQS